MGLSALGSGLDQALYYFSNLFLLAKMLKEKQASISIDLWRKNQFSGLPLRAYPYYVHAAMLSYL